MVANPFKSLVNRFWEPYLPYGITETQKSIEDCKDVANANERVERLLGIFDQSLALRGVHVTQKDIYQGLKLLSMHGALPYEQGANIYEAMAISGKYDCAVVDMVGVLCLNEAEDDTPADTKKHWAQRTYKSRYAPLAPPKVSSASAVSSDHNDDGVNQSRRNFVLLRASVCKGPDCWFQRHSDISPE